MLKYPRADSLPLIRDFVFTINQGIISHISDFHLVVPGWKRTRCYHYWSAIRDLDFAYLSNRSIKLTASGSHLANVGVFNRFQLPGSLSYLEKKCFSHSLFKYSPFQSFLLLFLKEESSLSSLEDFFSNSSYISFSPNPDNRRKMIVYTTDGRKIFLSQNVSYSFRWTIKQWCKQLDILDELWIEKLLWRLAGFNDNIMPTRIFFPIKYDLSELNVDNFKKLLNDIINEISLKHIPIPILTYIFCITHYCSVRDFHSKLIECYHSDPYHYYLETGSLIGTNERYKNILNYDYYPEVDGYIRSYLIKR